MNLTSLSLGLAAVVELLAAVVVVIHAGRALHVLVLRGGIDAARLILAQGVLAALDFSLAATLLKVLGLQQWTQIRTFATVFILRTLLKQVFLRERAGAEQRTLKHI